MAEQHREYDEVVRLLGALDKRLAVMETRLDGIALRLDAMVTRTEFWPVKVLVYGGTGTILLAVMGAIVAMVVNGR